MNYATVVISGNRACVVDRNTVTAGTIGGRVTFTFDKTWDGMEKTLVWKGSGVTLDDTACTGLIPAEAVAQAGGHLMVGVYGTRENTATPTLWADLGVILPGADPSGDESVEPNLPVWAQLQQQLQEHLENCAAAEDGKDGISATHQWNGTVLTVTSASGTSSADLKGAPGRGIAYIEDYGDGTMEIWFDDNEFQVVALPKGDPGKTPVKGQDYWTQADQKEMVSETVRQLTTDTLLPETEIREDSGLGHWDSMETAYCMDLPRPIVLGKTYTVTVDGTEYTATAVPDESGVYAPQGAILEVEDVMIAFQEGGTGIDSCHSAAIVVGEKHFGAVTSVGGYHLLPFTLSIAAKDAGVSWLPALELVATLADGTTAKYRLYGEAVTG